MAIDVERMPQLVKYLFPAALYFGIAFAVDLGTGQRYSSVWGSMAIVATVVTALPVLRPSFVALGGYGAVWVVFNLIRAIADDLPLALAGEGTIARMEEAMFGGILPTAWLQERWFSADRLGVHNGVLSAVHASFFVVPFAVALLLWWRHRALFRPYLIATALTFALGAVGFVLLPTAPPWMSDPGDVTRVTHHVISSAFGVTVATTRGDAGYGFEPNHIAALPSVHVAVTVLVFLVTRHISRVGQLVGGLYASLMTASFVYLGEHFVLDAVLGWIVALSGWWLARRFR
jgi:hypothetical protein